jgi:hypothetical protein
MTSILDLKALRCPAAMIYVRRAINNAIDAKFNGEVQIHTIEASMARDLALYINSCDATIRIGVENIKDLSEKQKAQWLKSGEATECELKGIEQTRTFTLMFN